jgi:flagellar export protein FliJ
MAKGLETLIRLNEWSVDQKRRKLGDLLSLIDGFEAELRKLEQDLINEQATAAASPNEAGFLYGYYADAVVDRRAIIKISTQQLEKDADEAREEVSHAYRELQKFKTAMETRKKREEAELASKEQLELDEVGIRIFNHKRA